MNLLGHLAKLLVCPKKVDQVNPQFNAGEAAALKEAGHNVLAVDTFRAPAVGISFSELCSEICRLALARREPAT